MKHTFVFLVMIILSLSIIVSGCYDGAYSNSYYDGSGKPDGSIDNPFYAEINTHIYEGVSTNLTGLLYGDSGEVHAITKPSGDIVGTTEIQTLTNKTLNNPYLTGTFYTQGNGFYSGADSLFIQNTVNDESALTLWNINNGAYGSIMDLYAFSNTPAVNDRISRIWSRGRNTAAADINYGDLRCVIVSPVSGNESSSYEWWLYNSGSQNKAMTLSGDGILKVDDSYDTFDEYDDAELLREGISNENKLVLIQAGIIEIKLDENGNEIPNKYQINLQNMLKILAGGIYQNRDYIESIEDRIKILEGK